ncbi:signal peptide peptidase SppA [Methanococcus voltae]|uniref:Protease-4 n=2 Tax=Methanococcus voltae TaxID=2188 RepID=A0A8J7RMC2_METVO|nr:signal peptide peptidase SppA [Methanococcus voltae]MBP2172577.1 protease-4 [Methanococcus voltae]MBP2201516.1 protease-4 [Methanococcus voltae]MCS3922305.1 protease-4 [Methanococcus voltae PS]
MKFEDESKPDSENNQNELNDEPKDNNNNNIIANTNNTNNNDNDKNTNKSIDKHESKTKTKNKNSKSLVYLFIVIIVIAILLTSSLYFVNLLGAEEEHANIALIDFNGALYLDTPQDDLFTEYPPDVYDYIDWLDEAEKNPDIKGIIIKINSPGGSSIASTKLAKKIKEVSKTKPTIAYIEAMGASAAYSAASSTGYIISEKEAIVGSIGVRMDILHYYGLMEKIGVNSTIIKGGKYKDIASPYRPMTEEEHAMLQRMVNNSYVEFVSQVAEDRNMTYEQANNLAQGKIYDGRDALKLGLVDENGDFDQAVKVLAKRTNLSPNDVSIKTYSKEDTRADTLFGFSSKEAFYYVGKGIGSEMSRSFSQEMYENSYNYELVQ